LLFVLGEHKNRDNQYQWGETL